nr:MAG TPA: Cell wall hydrolase autolysin [Caudoviricetes sp.]
MARHWRRRDNWLFSGVTILTKIVITAGHSNTDPGAVYDGNKEADYAADMRNYVAYYLRNWGFDVVTDGEGRVNAPLAQAVRLIPGSDLAVEFHLNASTNKTAKGIEVLCRDNRRQTAQNIAKAIQSVTGSTLRGDNGWKPEDSGQHKRLAFVSAGGLIVELGFISNFTEMKTLMDKRWLVAKAIAEAIREEYK